MNTTLPQLKTPLLNGSCINSKREELKQYFKNTWQTYESLFSLINKDMAYFLKPEPLRHPLIFYYGHTATFFINKLILGKYIDKRIDKRIESVCAVGVDEMSWDDLNTDNYHWPTVDEVKDYRASVYLLMLNLIETMDLTLPISKDSLAWIVLMGCEHERIHLETSSVIMRMLPLEHLTPSTDWAACESSNNAPINKLLSVKGQTLSLGKKNDDHTYGWDNEYGELLVKVDNFSASKFLVTNQEFLSFVETGGYQKKHYWTEEGQHWLLFKKPCMPVFWFKKGEQYFQRNLASTMPLPLNWPVEVNYLEAKAFCQWKSKQTSTYIKLPNEAQWYCLREQLAGDVLECNEVPANINLSSFASSCPVDYFADKNFANKNTAENPFNDIVGNVWQWTETAIDGYNGFKVHPLYDDFSTPTFDGKHNLIKGGSWISTGNETIKSSRYAFRRHFFQHAGFRYIETENNDLTTSEVNPYESDSAVCQQLESHYGSNYFNCANYPKTLAEFVTNTLNEYAKNNSLQLNKCLDLGCSVGRTAFELSAIFKQVDAIDFSARFIQHGVQLQNEKNVRYTLKNQGDLVSYKEISLANLPIKACLDNIHFSQGDATNLKAKYSQYDVVLAQNILENSYDPELFFSTIHQRINEKGFLVVTSNYNVSETITAKNKWLGGLKINGENVTGIDGLTERLAVNFELVSTQDIPRVLVNAEREYLVSNIECTIWRKR